MAVSWCMMGSHWRISKAWSATFPSPHSERRLIRPAERHAVDHGLHRLEQQLALALVVAGVEERGLGFHEVHDRDVAGGADLQRADFRRTVDDLGGRRGR